MSCKEFQKEMDQWSGLGPFTPSSESLFHLRECPDCYQECMALQALQEALHQDSLSAPDDIFWQKQNASIMARLPQKKIQMPWFSRVFAFAFLLIAFGVAFFNYESKVKKTPVSSEISLAWIYDDEDESLDEIVEDLDIEEVQKAIQSLENDHQRRIL